MSTHHYENFPVASFLLPCHLRQPVMAIYHFARTADDIADEGKQSAAERLSALGDFRHELHAIQANHLGKLGERTNLLTPIFGPLRIAIRDYKLPLTPFYDLLDAFTQDIVKVRYADFDALLAYCQCSANPIGRLLLCLYDAENEENFYLSDAICTSLQLINFWQDIALDWEKGRVYLPEDEMRQFGVGEGHIAIQECDEAWRQLFEFQLQRARKMLINGSPLGKRLPGRIGLELRMIIAGGLRILDKLAKVRGDVFRHRPVLRAYDWVWMLGHTFR